MAKLIVKSTDSHHKFGFKRGDVVAVLNDDDDEGQMVRDGAVMPDGLGTIKRLFRVVNVPGDASEYAALIAKGEQIMQDGKLITPLRRSRLDLDAIEMSITSKEGKELTEADTISIAKADVDANKSSILFDNELVL